MGNIESDGKLTKRDLKFITICTHLDKEVVIKWHKHFINKYPNGKMNLKALVKTYRKLLPDRDVLDFAMYVFRVTDLDQNGYIDFKEFLQLMNLTSNSSFTSKLKWAFRLYDLNGDGKISIHEMTLFLFAVYKVWGKDLEYWTIHNAVDKADKLFAKLDTNKDGFLSEEEFINGCQNDGELTRMIISDIFSITYIK